MTEFFFSRFVEIVFSFLKLLRLYFQADTRAHGIAISNREMILLNFNTNNNSGEFYLFIQQEEGGIKLAVMNICMAKGCISSADNQD